MALIFVRIVDAKSPLTMQHSLGTARLARFLAYKAGLSKEVQDKMEVAGLLHDLGKLRVPNEILEKPGKLNREERSLIERHSFETYKILSGIKGLEDITLWAACHHETPDGQGYPFRLAGEDLTLEMRIIAVSDVFQALAQRRPYRPSLSAAEVLEMLRGFVGQRRLDGAVVEMIGHDLEQTWALATGSNLKAEFAGGDGSNPVETPDGPVSYTHLDVYKRQVLSRRLSGRSDRRGPLLRDVWRHRRRADAGVAAGARASAAGAVAVSVGL